MTKHQKIEGTPSLSRRSFIVGTTATGMVLGYAALPNVWQSLAAAPASFEPTAWYAIGNDGKVVVTVAKADMGQHIASTMAQLIAEELEASWKDMSIVFAPNDPKYNDPVLGIHVTGGSWSTEMNFDAMSSRRCRRPHHVDQGRVGDAGRSRERTPRQRVACLSREIKERSDLC